MSNDLLIKEPWYDKHCSQELVQSIYVQLIDWTSDVVHRFQEVPFGYTEWTLSGHLAMAANRAGFFCLQDYVAHPAAPRGKMMERRKLRPDLYARGLDGRDCVFEIKFRNIGLEERKFWSRVNRALEESWDKEKGYAHEEAEYCCALVGMPVFAHVMSWSEECGTSARNRVSCDGLFSAFQAGCDAARSQESDPRESPNFYWAYFIQHEHAKREKDNAVSGNYDPIAMGMLWVGRVTKSIRQVH